jgi:hypothetical protein
MAVRVQWETDGPFAICDTAAEAVELLRQARSTNGTTSKAHQAPPRTASKGSDDKVGMVLNAINDKSKKVLVGLLNAQDGTGAEALGQSCGIDASGIGGTLGSISKAAKKAHLDLQDFVKTETRVDTEKRRTQWYTPGRLLLEHRARFL